MARIPTYQKDTHISDLDRIIGTDGDTNELVTKNFFLGDIAEYVIDKFIDPTRLALLFLYLGTHKMFLVQTQLVLPDLLFLKM